MKPIRVNVLIVLVCLGCGCVGDDIDPTVGASTTYPPPPPPTITETATITDPGPDLGSPTTCDDSPKGGEDECKVVFVREATSNGGLGGLSGADEKCQSAAFAAGLQGTYLAWLSTSEGSPVSRFKKSSVPYRRIDGVEVAENWSGLVDGGLTNAINVTEQGNPPVGNVWTNTVAKGTGWGGSDCQGWTDSESAAPGNGYPPNKDTTWTQGGVDSGCGAELHIYCFEQ